MEAIVKRNAIKSVQIQLVEHSLISRRIIKLEKEIEKLKDGQIPRERSARFYFRMIRVSLFHLQANFNRI